MAAITSSFNENRIPKKNIFELWDEPEVRGSKSGWMLQQFLL